jgi:hypothetical protein
MLQEARAKQMSDKYCKLYRYGRSYIGKTYYLKKIKDIEENIRIIVV